MVGPAEQDERLATLSLFEPMDEGLLGSERKACGDHITRR
mgnify:CR=1 FL=1